MLPLNQAQGGILLSVEPSKVVFKPKVQHFHGDRVLDLCRTRPAQIETGKGVPLHEVPAQKTQSRAVFRSVRFAPLRQNILLSSSGVNQN